MDAPWNDTELVGLPRAAERLGLHRATINAMIHDGRIRAVRQGPHWYIRRGELERFAATYRRPKNAPTRRPPKDPLAGTAGRVLDILVSWDAATASELAEVLNLHPGNVRKHLCLLERRGFVRRSSEGSWSAEERVESSQSGVVVT